MFQKVPPPTYKPISWSPSSDYIRSPRRPQDFISSLAIYRAKARVSIRREVPLVV
jgi:hypothetical protein